jgi:myo-inositol-1(or 4)-monophosphatase
MGVERKATIDVGKLDGFEVLSTQLLTDIVAAGSFSLTLREEGLEATQKLSKTDLVTNGDTAVSKELTRILRGHFHDIAFLDEEASKTHSLDVKRERMVAVIDPIDGTTNYSKGFVEGSQDSPNENWGVSVGMVLEGELVAGVIYQPSLAALFYAEKGKGAYRNGVRMTASTTVKLGVDSLIYAIPYSHDTKEFNATTRAIQRIKEMGINPIVLGSQVIEAMYVAQGLRDVFMMFKTKPWDIAAAISIVTEAGGRVTTVFGEPYELFEETILLSNGAIDTSDLVRIAREELS